jgi:adenylate cyclase
LKNHLWLWQLPIVLLCVLAYSVSDLGVEGRLENEFLREQVFPKLRKVSTIFSDFKFQTRGPQPPKNKVVIVDVDSDSIQALGRFPWHRDMYAAVIDTIFSYGAKTVGLDMVFSEEDPRVPAELAAEMPPEAFAGLQRKLETDPKLADLIAHYHDRLVLGWTADQQCQTLYQSAEFQCPVNDPKAADGLPPGMDKFAVSLQAPLVFDFMKSPVNAVLTAIGNLDRFNLAAGHAGFFNISPDSDGVMRRSELVMLVPVRDPADPKAAAGTAPIQVKVLPSLALEMARVGLGERLDIRFDEHSRIESLRFANSGQRIPISPVGATEVNFRGGARTFPYISVADLLKEGDRLQDDGGRKLAGLSKLDIFKDAYVLLGVSAVGVYDLRSFPFSNNVPGVEGHATILDNILSNDFLTSGQGWWSSRWLYPLMIVGGLLFGLAVQRLDAVPALLCAVMVFGGFGFFDLKVLFARNIQWNTSFLFVELSLIFMCTIAAKYVLEERNKRFVRGAFAKYVAPAVVDSILKDPTKLVVGGEKKDMTILFSDIRGFTTFSEKMDAKALSAFLNDYLSIQTTIVFGNEGTLDKYIGDAIMAFWGAPLDQSLHAAHACTAAIQMMQALEANRPRFKEQYGVVVDIGIGLNSGVVSVGNMGSNENFAYTVIGDHVNLASRLEGLTKYYGAAILTSRYTLDTIAATGQKLPPHRVLDHVKVKGKQNAVEMIQILEREYPARGLTLFEEARILYTRQRWDEAEAKFHEANEEMMKGAGGSPDRPDGASKKYLERIEFFRANPPGTEWDGAWEMHEK